MKHVKTKKAPAFDFLLLCTSLGASLVLKYDLQFRVIPQKFYMPLLIGTVVYAVFTIIFIVLFGLYDNISNASINDLVKVILATLIGNALILLVGLSFDVRLPYTCYIINWILSICMVGGRVFFVRIIREFTTHKAFSSRNMGGKVLIIGANKNAAVAIEYLTSSNSHGVPVAIMDDSLELKNKRIKGVKIVGTVEDVGSVADKYKIDTILICIEDMTVKYKKELLDKCMKTKCTLKVFIPFQDSLATGGIARHQIKKIDYVDLLSRPEIELDKEVCAYITDKVILVTGGGGSIGSEICRQLCYYQPKQIVIFDIYENNAYELMLELKQRYSNVIDIQVCIGSVRDIYRLDSVYREFSPAIVFHAAAHKHVPLMEDSPGEAVKNNIFGTLNNIETAKKYNIEKFILLSTDKAVNATSVMGSTKRVAELIIQSNKDCNTVFAAVRFGNVLGSNGSVVPIFQKQIDEGGPITITHPDITRYFMTIPEAAQLVVQAGGLAHGGEIFILDMGEPVRILDLARNLIRISGYEPGIDINIVYTGLRPGEKMYEELSYVEESDNISKTSNEKIFVLQPIEKDETEFFKRIEVLRDIAETTEEKESVLKELKCICATYTKEIKRNLV